MQAAAAAGDPDALQGTWRETRRAAAARDQFDEPSPDTVNLYRQLRAALQDRPASGNGRSGGKPDHSEDTASGPATHTDGQPGSPT
jgi:hypothetical protein